MCSSTLNRVKSFASSGLHMKHFNVSISTVSQVVKSQKRSYPLISWTQSCETFDALLYRALVGNYVCKKSCKLVGVYTCRSAPQKGISCHASVVELHHRVIDINASYTAPNKVTQPEFNASQGPALMAIPRAMKVPSDAELLVQQVSFQWVAS